MGDGNRQALRLAVTHLERFRGAIEAEVNRRMGREEPPPEVRAELIRRFRTFCRLAALDPRVAKPSLDGLGGNRPAALERAVATAVDVACQCAPPEDVARALRDLEGLFRAGIRRTMDLEPVLETKKTRGRKRRPNAGKRVRAAIDRISDAYVAVNLDTGQILDVNPAAESLLGTDAEKLLDRPFGSLIAPSHRLFFTDLESRLDAGEDGGLFEVALARPDGASVAVELGVAQHTISGHRLAIFTARERLPGAVR